MNKEGKHHNRDGPENFMEQFPPMVYHETGSVQAAFNLSLEETLLDSLGPQSPGGFMLWKNAPAVILGRHQNAIAEVNLPELRARNIALVRRMTGGGAVYHDLGNLNFTFLLPQNSPGQFQVAGILEPMIRFLRSRDVPARMQGRNDLSLGEHGKFSGLAFRALPGKYQLHGTILYDVELDTLQRVLNVDREKYTSKGVASVRARVVNLKPFFRGTFSELWAGIRDAYGFPEAPIPERTCEEAEKRVEEKYSQARWNLGQSPPGNILLKRRFSFGLVELHLRIEKNRIAGVKITGDFFTSSDWERGEDPIGVLEAALLSLDAHDPALWAESWSRWDLSRIFHGCAENEEILRWLSPTTHKPQA